MKLHILVSKVRIQRFDYSGNLRNQKDIADRTIRIYQQAIREQLNLQIFDDTAKKLVLSTMNQSAEVKDESADII